MPTNKIIAKLKIKGTPAPRNTPTSPFLATSKANKPQSGQQSDAKSYEFILRQANKNALDALPHGASNPGRRLEYLSRLQHANFGISTMDSSYIISEDHIVNEHPRFVLCGQPVNGYSPNTIVRYLNDQRVGSYKTSAQEMYRARHSVKSRATRSEPSGQSFDRNSEGVKSAKSEFRDDKSNTSSFVTMQSSTTSDRPSLVKRQRSDKPSSLIELKGRNLRSVNGISQGWSNYASSDFMSTRSKSMNVKPESELFKSTDSDIDNQLGSCLKVNNNNQTMNGYSSDDGLNGTKTPKYVCSFIKRGIRNFNNPYRLLKHREKSVMIRSRNLDMKTVRKITNMNTTRPNSTGKQNGCDPAVVKLSEGGSSSDTIVLQMVLDTNSPKGRQSNASGKYSDIALHRDLDEYIVVRSSSAQSKSPSKKSTRIKSDRSNLDELEEESSCNDDAKVDGETGPSGNDSKTREQLKGRTKYTKDKKNVT